ncbi:MAG: nitroreductase [Chloroflexota bacterium]
MNVIEAIYARQSIGRVKPDPVPRAEIEKMLGAAVQAPNHYKVRPWRFVVLTGSGRERLGEAMAEAIRRKFPQVDGEGLDKERAKPLRAPLVVAVGVDRPAEARVVEIENICAAAAACENLLLAATGMGLAGYWRTGDAARDPEVKEFLGLAPDQELLAFLYLGYPETPPEKRERPGFEDRTTWLD